MKSQILHVLLLLCCLNVIAAPAPVISTLVPTSAAVGMTVQINGTDLLGAISVKFGGTPAASFTVVSAIRINAVVAQGSSGQVEVINADGTALKSGFVFIETSGMITDFGGFWNTTGAAPNAVSPDNSHHLLAFTYNNTTYSTGVNDARLTSHAVNYIPGNFKALPVAGITGNTPATGSSVYVALAKNVDGSPNIGNASAVSHYTVMKSLTDGINGLDMGTGITNMPASANISFQIFNINPATITDGEPDLILTQIASPSPGNDVFSFVDANGAIVGNSRSQDMTLLPAFGSYQVDLFNLTPRTSYNKASAYSFFQTGSRDIRLLAIKLSEFGITTDNVSQIRALKIDPSSNSDYAFIAYNANSINLPPNVSRSESGTNETICAGGTSNLEVVASASSGGVLSYAWEQSTTGGSSWTVLAESAPYTGVHTNRISIVNPAAGTQYRLKVTETGNINVATSAVFTIAVSSPAPPTAASIGGGASICVNSPAQLTSTVTGGTNVFYQWQRNISGTYQDIPAANADTYLPPVNATGANTYRLSVSGGSGCGTSIVTNTATITVAGISGTTPTAVCTGTAVTLSATAAPGGSTIDWYNTDASAGVLFSGGSYSPPGVTATRTYYVTTPGCASALRVPVTATVYPITNGGSITGGTTVSAGNNSTLLTLNANNGPVLKWQSSTDAFDAVIHDIAQTAPELTVTNISQNTQFRALVQSGTCPAAFSATTSVNVFVTLAINNKSIRVSGQNNGVLIQWTTAPQAGVNHYEVERSANGSTFTVISKVDASREQQSLIIYKSFDPNPLPGTAYYRIKEVKVDGNVSYSDIQSYLHQPSKGAITAYPNPISGLEMQLKFDHVQAGEYQIRMFSNAGQVMLQTKYQHDGSIRSHRLKLPTGLGRGNYKVEISGPENKSFSVVVL